MNVLAILSHPDDVECYCAGTLIKCVKRGDKVTICHVCNGNMGHMVIEPEELRKIRIEEAKRAGKLAGIEVVTCDIGDCLCDPSSKEQRDKVAEVIRTVDPDFIITHSPDDYMIDHVSVSKLVFDASFVASIPHYKTSVDKPSKIVPIFYAEPASGVGFVPTEYVDITEELDLRLKMMECHESQIKWLKDHNNNDVLDGIRNGARYRGKQCGVKYAEAFRQCMVALKIVPRRLLP